MAVRFTINKNRFVVRENSIRVYQRVDTKDISTEYAVSPQKRARLIKKYKDQIEDARVWV